jgi:hypothetical protein
MKKIAKVLVFPFFAAISSFCYAFDIDTHAKINYVAVRNSVVFTDQGFYKRLGIDYSKVIQTLKNREKTYSLGDYYKYPNANNSINLNAYAYDHENQGDRYDINGFVFDRHKFFRYKETIREDEIVYPYYISDWISRGNIREDDARSAFSTSPDRMLYDIAITEYGQPTDIEPNIHRFCNHFFDPYYNIALSPITGFKGVVACGPDNTNLTAVKWAMGTVMADGSGSKDLGKINPFTFADAREAQWRALTGKTGTMESLSAGNSQKERTAWWATTFRTLGDVTHLLQDMSQPQHTRDEAHPFGVEKTLEVSTDARAMVRKYKQANGQMGFGAPLIYQGYQPPMFTEPRHFFSTGGGNASFTGKGLANYSNANFFTTNNNMHNSRYFMPIPDLARYTQVDIVNSEVNATETYLMGTILDSQSGERNTIKMSRHSIFSEEVDQVAILNGAQLPQSLTRIRYSIDQPIIDGQTDLLIPRAVGYTAGLINYFFRGRLEVRAPADGPAAVIDAKSNGADFTKLRLRVKNTTAPILDPIDGVLKQQHMTAGRFVAVVRFHLDKEMEFYPNFPYNRATGLTALPASGGTCGNWSAVYDASGNKDPNLETACRKGEEDIAVSKDFVGVLDADNELEFAFDFSADPIPLSALDVSVQVVYRGPLGAEQDGIAVETVRWPDPHILAFHNATDLVVINNRFSTRLDVNEDKNINIYINPALGCPSKWEFPFCLGTDPNTGLPYCDPGRLLRQLTEACYPSSFKADFALRSAGGLEDIVTRELKAYESVRLGVLGDADSLQKLEVIAPPLFQTAKPAFTRIRDSARAGSSVLNPEGATPCPADDTGCFKWKPKMRMMNAWESHYAFKAADTSTTPPLYTGGIHINGRDSTLYEYFFAHPELPAPTINGKYRN